MNQSKKEKWLIILSFATIYIVWGSTFLANKYAIDFMPPWMMAGARFTIAGVLILGFLRCFRWEEVSRKQWLHTWLVGILIMTIGVGFPVWAQQFVDSGLTALIIGIEPLMVVFLSLLILGKRPRAKAILGVFLGLAGMYLLVQQEALFSGAGAFGAVLMILFGVFTWSLATVILPKLDIPASKVQSTGMQLLTSGFTLLLISLFAGEFESFELESVTWLSWAAWAYLIFFGSIAAFSAFNYLLEKVSPEKVATTAYVNPVIAVLLGWWFRDELLTGQTVVAAAVMLTGVFFINNAE